MSFHGLKRLTTKADVDNVIRNTDDKLVVLRFGRDDNVDCMQIDKVLDKCQREVSKMAVIYIVDVDAVPIYRSYFDITIIPSVVFFFNAQHMKCDYGTQDHTKWVGPFVDKQDFIDLVWTFYRGAVRGKLIVQCPIDSSRVPKYQLFYQDI
mmetsp:Transcript_13211/g.33715  ORF Transcript_13211/g.33715 Transcript_13211/m.33715 type:complete len:151 (+) Transcript_13211:47-499(+)